MAVVLVVDDSAVDRTRAGGLLKKDKSLSPIYAPNGREALAIIAEKSPDVVLTDLQMPEMDGLELVETIRRDSPSLPVILMTAHGSEETAIRALRKGATNYVAKRNLAHELIAIVQGVLEIARADRGQQQILSCLTQTESRYEIDNNVANIPSLLDQLEAGVTRMQLCDRTDWMRIAVALREALVNAIYHGNLELTSQLLEEDEPQFAHLLQLRPREAPYSSRRVYVTARETRTEVTYVIRDDGQGFDPTTLPDPTDPANLDRRSGRGLFLIRTFMDEVRHNDVGNEITLVKKRDRPGKAKPQETT
jgi:CheY-like chemotaxis protein/anti-sigma regulatory factor (Ser/Thr protein kinase)